MSCSPYKKKIFPAILLATGISIHTSAQHTLEILCSDSSQTSSPSFLLKEFSFRKNTHSAGDARKELSGMLLKMYDNGYLAASFDSIVQDSAGTKAFLHAGNAYLWASLEKGNADDAALAESGFGRKLFTGKPVSYKNVSALLRTLVHYYENHGYPFAAAGLDSVTFGDTLLNARIRLEKNNLIIIDSIADKGQANISEIYLQNYLGIKQGDYYNEAVVSRIGNRIRELPFVREKQPFNVVFFEKKCRINLFLETKKANQLDGIVGIVSDKQNTGKVLLTGEAHMKLHNALGNGELIDINWKNPSYKTQDLRTHFTYPFVVLRYGLNIDFSLYKKDTSYIDVIKNIGIQYLLTGGNYLKVFVNNKTTSLLSTKSLSANLPFADLSSTIYGMGIKSEKVDYRMNPRQGYSIEVNAGAGNKHIEKNRKIKPELYDSLLLNATQYHSDYTFDFYFPVRERNVINFGLKGAHLISRSIMQNELFRIGGLKTIRGFDEESIFASSFDIMKMEYRYLLEQNSYLCLFANGAYYENRSTNFTGDRYDMPYGFGAGITFETKPGIFSVNYAIGKEFANALQFRSGKVHFGIISYF